MWDFLMKLQEVLLWVLSAAIVLLAVVICVAAYVGAKNRSPRDKGDDDELE